MIPSALPAGDLVPKRPNLTRMVHKEKATKIAPEHSGYRNSYKIPKTTHAQLGNIQAMRINLLLPSGWEAVFLDPGGGGVLPENLGNVVWHTS